MLGVSRAALLGALPFSRQAYGDSIMAINPVAYWRLGESGGTTIVDERAVQNGSYTGNVEFGVASLLGESTGTAAGFDGHTAFGQIPHHTVFALSSYTVDFAFQADTAPIAGGNRVLLSKDHAPSPPGGLSIEIFNNGSQLKLRAYAGGLSGAAWIGSAAGVADLELHRSYKVTLTIDGSGAKLYLDGDPVASEPLSTAGLVTNTAPFVLGAWSSAGAGKFDGVLDEVALFGRALNPAEIALLAQASSIDHADDGIPVEPPAGATVWVAPGGTAAWPGTQQAPMGNIAAAIRGSGPGDVIAVLGSAQEVYEETNQVFTNKHGTAANPIRVVGYGPVRPSIDNSLKEFRNGTPASPTGQWVQVDAAKHIWQSVSTYSSVGGVGVHGYGPLGDGGFGAAERTRLLPYTENTFDAFHSSINDQHRHYCGPGLILHTNNKIRIRTETALFSEALGYGDFPTNKNPNQQDVVVFNRANDTIWAFDNCSWIQIGQVNLLYSHICIKTINGSNNLTFANMEIEGGRDYVQVIGNCSDILFSRITSHYNLPDYVAWRDFKGTNIPLTNIDGSSKFRIIPTSNTAFPKRVNFEQCSLWGGAHMEIGFWDKVEDSHVLNCDFQHCRDDVIHMGAACARIEIAYNWVYGRSAWFVGYGNSTNDKTQSSPGSIYIHHNVVNHSSPWFHDRGDDGGPSDEPVASPEKKFKTQGTRVGHVGGGGLSIPLTHKWYHNTIISAWNLNNGGVGTGLEYPEGFQAPASAAAANWIVNNIVVQTSSHWSFYRDVRFHVDNIADGNCYRRAIPQSFPAFADVLRANGTRSNFPSLAAIKNDAAFMSGSTTLYAPGFEASGVEVDPGFVGGSLPIAYPGHFDFASLSEYRPTNPQVTTGAVSLVGKGWPGPQDSVYQPWRGALNPDGNGSEVGMQ